jgi:hypothetical protein
VLGYAVEQACLTVNPCTRTAPKRRRIKQSQADLRFLIEVEFATACRLPRWQGEDGDLPRVAVGTGRRFGELTALWVSDVGEPSRSVNHRQVGSDGGDGRLHGGLTARSAA